LLDGARIEEIYLLQKHGITADQLMEAYIADGEDLQELKLKGLQLSSVARLLKDRGVKRTHKESHRTTGYLSRLEAGMIKSLGVKNPSQSPIVKDKKRTTYEARYGVTCNLRTPAVIAKAHAGAKKVAKKTYQTTASRLKESRGVTNVAQLPGARSKNSASQKKRMLALTKDQRRAITAPARAALTGHPHFTSRVEERVAGLITSLFHEIVQRHVFLWDYNFDVRVGRTLVEVQGDFWHANPACEYSRDDELLEGLLVSEVWDKDAAKKRMAEQNGFKLLALWEGEINAMTDAELLELLTKEVQL
jgi:hypothetical protein